MVPELASSLRFRLRGVATYLHLVILNLYKVEDVVSLKDHNTGWIPNYLDAKEVMELVHVCHLEFVGEEELDLVAVA